MELRQGTFTRSFDAADGSDRARPRFHFGSVADEGASARAGRPVFKQVELVEVFLPGNPYLQPVIPVTDVERQRWAKAYEQFRANEDQPAEGTPIKEWSVLTRSQVLELQAIGFQTIEELAAMSDNMASSKIGMGGMAIRDKAKAYCEQAAGMAPITQLVEENEGLKAQLASQSNQLSELRAILDGLSAQMAANNNRPPVSLDPPAPLAPPAPAVADSSLASFGQKRGRKAA